MITTILLVLLIIDCFVLIAAVLLQSGKGSGIAASFGGVSSSPDAFIGTRQAGNLLTTISWWSGGIFIFISFILQITSVHTRAPKSVLEQGLTPPPAAPAPTPNSNAPALPFQSNPATPPASGAPANPGSAPKTPAPKGATPTPK